MRQRTRSVLFQAMACHMIRIELQIMQRRVDEPKLVRSISFLLTMIIPH